MYLLTHTCTHAHMRTTRTQTHWHTPVYGHGNREVALDVWFQCNYQFFYANGWLLLPGRNSAWEQRPLHRAQVHQLRQCWWWRWHAAPTEQKREVEQQLYMDSLFQFPEWSMPNTFYALGYSLLVTQYFGVHIVCCRHHLRYIYHIRSTQKASKIQTIICYLYVVHAVYVLSYIVRALWFLLCMHGALCTCLKSQF